mgnify:CR=1 FL=1
MSLKTIDLRKSCIKQNKLKFRESMITRKTNAIALLNAKLKKNLSETEQIEVVHLFAEKINEVIKMFIYPVLYKTIVYFYLPAIDSKYLENIREQLINEIT